MIIRSWVYLPLAIALALALPASASDIGSSNFSETAASNNATPPNGWPAGMNPAQVHPAARELMAAIKRWYNRIQPIKTSGGTANVQTLTYDVATAAYVTGDVYRFKVGAGLTNTGATTLNIDVLGAKAVQYAGAALTRNEIVAGRIVTVYYDGTQFQLLDGKNITKVALQTFSTTGTYTPATGLLYAIAECVGGGGGGGGTAAATTGASAGGAGGAGSYARIRLTASQIGASQAVTVPAAASGGAAGNNNGTAGSDVSLGTLLVCKGGGAGGGSTQGTAGAIGAGGVAGTGDVAAHGASGIPGTNATITTVIAFNSVGGSSPWGGSQPPAAIAGGVVTGQTPSGYGAGGNGGVAQGSASTAAGGNGAPGYLVVTEFISE